METEITVIIPTYEPKEYIECCINSLLNQTLEKRKYEILIVINGNKEPYYTQLEKKYKNEEILKIIFIEETGVSNARNVGISTAKTRYIIFVDDDDFVSKYFLKDLYHRRVDNGIVVSNTLVVTKEKKIEKDYLGKHFLNKKKNGKRENLFFHRKQLSNSCGKLIPKSIINTKFNVDLKKSEDSLFMAEIAENIEKVEYSKKRCIYYRRIRENSASRKSEKKFEKLLRKKSLIKLYLKLIKKSKKKIFVLTRILAQLKN